MELQGQFFIMGTGPVTQKFREEFEDDGLRPPTTGVGSATSGTEPLQEIVSAWFYLEAMSPGLAGAIASEAVHSVHYIVSRMTHWFKSGESLAPDARNHIAITLGGPNDPTRRDIKIELGPDYSADDIAKIVRSTLEYPNI